MTKLQPGYGRFIKIDVLHERELDAYHDLQIYQGKSEGLHFGQYKMQTADCTDCRLGLKCILSTKCSPQTAGSV